MNQIAVKQTQGRGAPISGARIFYSMIALTTLAMFVLVLMSKSFSEFYGGNRGARWANYLDEILLIGLIVFVIAAIVVSRRLYIDTLILVLTLIFSLAGWIVTIAHQVRFDVALLGFLLIIKPLVILVVYQAIPFDRRSVALFLRWFDYVLFAIVLFAVVYALVVEIGVGTNPLPGVVPGEIRLGLAPSRSFFTHPSPFSSISTLIAFYAFANLLLRKSRRYTLMVALACLGVFLSLRMKAFFLLPVGIGIIFLLIHFHGFRISKKVLFLGLALLTIGVAASISFGYLFKDILTYRLANSSDSVRTLLFRNALVINQENYGFGEGYGMYGSSVSTDYHYSPLYYRFNMEKLRGATPTNPSFITDQWWAWYLGEIGIWTTLLFLGTLLYVTYSLTKLARYWRTRHIGMAALAYTAIGSLLFGIMAGFAGVYLTAPPTGYFIMALAGITFALHRGMFINADTGKSSQQFTV